MTDHLASMDHFPSARFYCHKLSLRNMPIAVFNNIFPSDEDGMIGLNSDIN